MPRLSPSDIPRRHIGMCMKAHKQKYTKSTLSKTNQYEGKSLDHDLESVAEELVDLARTQLPSGVMKGVLKGSEDDIRQEAILLALKWYIRHRAGNPTHGKSDWNPVQAICAALRFRKLDTIKRHAKEQKVRRALTIQQQRMNHESAYEEWSPAEIREVLKKSIQQALKAGRISHANASVAIQVYLDSVTVQELANQLGRSKSSIHQHLTRVRKAIPGIIHSMLD